MKRLKKRERHNRQLRKALDARNIVLEDYKQKLSNLMRRFHNFQVRVGMAEDMKGPLTYYDGATHEILPAKEY